MPATMMLDKLRVLSIQKANRLGTYPILGVSKKSKMRPEANFSFNFYKLNVRVGSARFGDGIKVKHILASQLRGIPLIYDDSHHDGTRSNEKEALFK